MSDNIAYKCLSCGAPLVFNPGTGDLHCEFCDSHFSVVQVEEALDKKRESSPEGTPQVRETACSAGADPLLTDKVYLCKNCGAELITTATTVATSCPYCNNNILLEDRVESSLEPDGIIPFAVSREKLTALLNTFYKNKPLLPRNFFRENGVERAQGVYVPFWLYDVKVNARATYHGTTTHTYMCGDDQVTETKHYRLHRQGAMSFSRIPVDGSKRMENDLMDSLEPYQLSGIVPFDGGYLSGFFADRYDEDSSECRRRAEKRISQSALDLLGSTTTGYSASLEDSQVEGEKWTTAYVLLPVWLFHCTYNGKRYRYAVNGQTGKVVGELPCSFWKGLLWFGGTAVVTMALALTVLVVLPQIF